MKTIYFISNNLLSNIHVVYPKEVTFKEAREKTMLGVKGEELAKSLSNVEELTDVDVIYSSSYVGALNTSKYIASVNNQDILVDNRLGERIVGELGSNEYRFLKGMQEHDFTYKLENGESLQDVKHRMEDFLRDILISDAETILVVTHSVALESLCLKWCDYEYSLDDHLILSFKENVIFDGTFSKCDFIEMHFEGNQCKTIQKKELNGNV